MDNFILCLNAVLPMFALMTIGFIIRKSGLFSEKEVSKANRMIFLYFYPAMMFENLYGSNLRSAVDIKLICFSIGSIFTILIISIPIIMRIEKSPKTRGAMIHAIFRSNFVIIGLPITTSVFGKGNVTVTAMLIAVVVPIYNVLAVVILEYFRGGKPSFVKIIKGVITNPLIIGAIFGIFFAITGIKLPNGIEDIVSNISATATTMAIVILGAAFKFDSVKKTSKNLIICIVSRLIIVPGIFLSLAALIGIRGLPFVTLIAMFAAPVAIASYTMAESMDSDGELAGNCVIFSSALSCFTMFLWLFLFKNIGIF